MTLSNYLTRRGKRGTWQLRVPVPRAYQRQNGGPTEKVKSLRTSDRAQASKRALPILSEWQSAWDGGQAPFMAGNQNDQRAAGDIVFEAAYENMLAALENDRVAWPADDEEYAARIAIRRADLRRYTRARNEKDLARWRPRIDTIIERYRLAIKSGTAAYDDLLGQFVDLNIAALDTFIKRTDGEIDAEPQSTLFQTIRAKTATKVPFGETLLELYDAYAKWRCEPGRKRRRRSETFEQDRVAVAIFAEFVGRHRNVGSISKDEAKAFRAMLSSFPASRAKKRNLAEASIGDCVAIAKRDGLPTLSLTTQAKYISILSPFFGWLVSDSTVSIPINIFDGLHHKLERGENRRPSFDAPELNALLASPLFQKCGGDRREHIAGDVEIRDWRYWIPLLCMFTGSRITEVAQLHVDDVAVREGVPLILLAHDEAKGQFVKNKKGRLAAVHKILVDAGFLAFCGEQSNRAQRDSNKQLFPDLVSGKRELLGDKPSKWFRRYLERVRIKHGADGLGAHSFRHTMADAMRAADYMDHEYGQLVLGHSNNSITAAYGSVPQGTPARLMAMINNAFEAKPFTDVDFEGLLQRRS